MYVKYKFIYEGHTISWKYIKLFYSHENRFNFRYAPKLTNSHIYPNNYRKMKVKFAVQVFSATVAVSLCLYIRFGEISTEAVATAQFVKRIDKLFYLLN